jgi:hypothetical protein
MGAFMATLPRTEENQVGSTPKHRAESPVDRSTRSPDRAGRRFLPMLVTIGVLIGVSGVVAGGAGILGVLRL